MSGAKLPEAVRRIPPPLREALAVHEALRRLHFAPEDIYLNASSAPQGMVQVLLRCGDKEFRYDAGDQGMSLEEVTRRWDEAVQTWNRLPTEEGMALWRSSQVYHQGVELVLILNRKGFALPAWAQMPEHVRALFEQAPVRGGQHVN